MSQGWKERIKFSDGGWHIVGPGRWETLTWYTIHEGCINASKGQGVGCALAGKIVCYKCADPMPDGLAALLQMLKYGE